MGGSIQRTACITPSQPQSDLTVPFVPCLTLFSLPVVTQSLLYPAGDHPWSRAFPSLTLATAYLNPPRHFLDLLSAWPGPTHLSTLCVCSIYFVHSCIEVVRVCFALKIYHVAWMRLHLDRCDGARALPQHARLQRRPRH